MSQWPIALGSLSAAAISVVVALAVAGVFDSGSPAGPGDGEGADSAALCVEGAEDCEDTVVPPGDDGDELTDAPPPDGSGSGSGTCLVGTPDCNDTPGDGDLPIFGDDGDTDDGEALAIEAAFAELATMGGPPASEFDEIEVRAVDWPDACLGVDTPGIACAQVITPGYVVLFDNGILAYEFHTDTNGNAVLANNPR